VVFHVEHPGRSSPCPVGELPQPRFRDRAERDRALLGVFHVEHQPMLPNMPATGQASPSAPACSTWNSPNDGARQHATPRGAGTSRSRRPPTPSGTPNPGALSGRWHGHRPRSAAQTTAPPAYGEGGRPLATTSFAAARATRRPAPAALRHAQPLPGGADALGCRFSDRAPSPGASTSPISRLFHVERPGRSHERYRWHAAAGRNRCGRLVGAPTAAARLFRMERPGRSRPYERFRCPRGSRQEPVRAPGRGTDRRCPPVPRGTSGPSRVHSLPVATGQP
jgi:hypothetical protein